MSSIVLAMDSIRLCKFTSPIATSRHVLKNIKEYLTGQVKLSEIHPIAVYCIRDYIN